MKKIVAVAVFISLLITGCSGNDDDKASKQIPEDEKMLESMIFDGEPWELYYNSNKTVRRLNIASVFLFDFNYTGGRVDYINVIAYGQEQTMEFSYADNGSIDGFTFNNEQKFVEYDEAENKYFVYNDENIIEYSIKFTTDGDLKEYYSYEYGNQYLVNYISDESKKGPMHNANNIQLYISLVYPDIGSLLIYFSKRPIELLSAAEVGNVEFTYTYDTDGFVTELINPISNDIIKYNYTRLEY